MEIPTPADAAVQVIVQPGLQPVHHLATVRLEVTLVVAAQEEAVLLVVDPEADPKVVEEEEEDVENQSVGEEEVEQMAVEEEQAGKTMLEEVVDQVVEEGEMVIIMVAEAADLQVVAVVGPAQDPAVGGNPMVNLTMEVLPLVWVEEEGGMVAVVFQEVVDQAVTEMETVDLEVAEDHMVAAEEEAPVLEAGLVVAMVGEEVVAMVVEEVVEVLLAEEQLAQVPAAQMPVVPRRPPIAPNLATADLRLATPMEGTAPRLIQMQESAGPMRSARTGPPTALSSASAGKLPSSGPGALGSSINYCYSDLTQKASFALKKFLSIFSKRHKMLL
jgi:hypothetical protein